MPGAFANAAETAINSGKLDNARALLTDALELAPNDRVLRDVNDKLATAEQQARLRQRSSELVAQIDSQLGSDPTLAQIAAITPALIELREIDSNHPVIERTAAAARSLLGANYDTITSIATVDDVAAFERGTSPRLKRSASRRRRAHGRAAAGT